MHIEVEGVRELRFADGLPVRAASAVARFGDGYLIAQDDATHAAWLRDDTVSAVRVLPPVEGLDLFEEVSGTKHLKPDLEAACELTVNGAPAVLLLGSGSAPARMRTSLVTLHDGEPRTVVADLSSLYGRVAEALAIDLDMLNMEGACVADGVLRWFQRGLPSAGLPTASVDLDLAAVLEAVAHAADVSGVSVSNPRAYDLGEVRGVGLAVTDAVPFDEHTILVSAAAEDTPNPRDDGPVVGSALAVLHGHEVLAVGALPTVADQVAKVEGLSILEREGNGARVLATVDSDDHEAPSLAVNLRVRW